jgi:beta-aspartyl-peptidase (threonine type)
MTNKRPGRVGDTPVIGAGTYAEEGVVAVSGTGSGEAFIRAVAGHDVAARVKYGGLAPEAAAGAVLDRIRLLGGRGGLILVGRDGPPALLFDTEGMYRGYAVGTAEPVVMIRREG